MLPVGQKQKYSLRVATSSRKQFACATNGKLPSLVVTNEGGPNQFSFMVLPLHYASAVG